MTFTTRHPHAVDAETFWHRIFLDDEYNRRLYVEGLDFKVYERLSFERHADGSVTRKLKLEPKAEVPPVIQKAVGGPIQYVDDGRFDPAKKVWTYSVTPSRLAEKVSISGKLWVEPRGEKSIEWVCEVSIAVKIFGVGGMIEKFLEQSIRTNYDEVAAFTNRFISEKSL